MSYPAHYAELCTLLRRKETLKSVGALLQWDQETYMPPAGAAARAEQCAAIAEIEHKARTDPRIGELLASCEGDASLTGDPASETAANLREMRRDYDLATKLPPDLVAELARTGSLSQEAWKHARQASNFKAFAPWLEKMMALTRRKAECYGWARGGEAYDALINEYEPGATAREIERVFTPLRARLSDLIARVADSGTKVDRRCLKARIPPAKQHEFGQLVLRTMGFDMNAARLDVTTHPFCSGIAPGDTRMTTRYRDEAFTDALYGTMHEGGHGLYEQGLPKSPEGRKPGRFGEPMADAISLGIHESQSRMWENFVGRSRQFWTWALPRARRLFGPALGKAGADAFYKAVNTCSPSFIRVEADEGTYNLHVMIRFEIERRMIAGDLKIKDVPAAWNRLYKDSLGLDVPDDRRGCLQDVHWSFGLVGYFPTYTLGNLYAAQIWETIKKKIPGLDAKIAKGDWLPLRDWLKKNIHQHGRRYRAAELCERVTGRPLAADALLRHLEGKLAPIYGI